MQFDEQAADTPRHHLQISRFMASGKPPRAARSRNAGGLVRDRQVLDETCLFGTLFGGNVAPAARYRGDRRLDLGLWSSFGPGSATIRPQET